MEGGKKQTASSSSLTNELFGSKESSSSSGTFGSIFSPPAKLSIESLPSDTIEKKHGYSNEAWNSKTGAPGDASSSYETESQGTANKDTSSMYQDQRVQPCHLSSSIYYGGQDVYSPRSPNSQGPGINSVFRNLLTCVGMLFSSKKMEKMILGVLREEIGGKDLSIINS